MDLSSKIECLTHSKILCMLLIMIWGRMSLIHPLVRLQSPKIYCWKETLFVFGVILSMLPPKGPNKNLVPLYHETHAVPRLVVHCCLNDAQMPMPMMQQPTNTSTNFANFNHGNLVLSNFTKW